MQITEELPKLSAAELVELQEMLTAELKKKQSVPWPDFAARRKRIFPDGPPPGKPISAIMDEARGDY